MRRAVLILLALMAAGGAVSETLYTIVDFGDADTVGRWRAVDDAVMGGVSRSELVFSEAGTAFFIGDLSLENNGGFASVRRLPDDIDLGDYDGIALRIRGDGRGYRFRLRTDPNFDGIAYQARFDAPDGEWVTLRLPFNDFEPTFRGRRVRGAAPLDTSEIRQMGFMIADKQEGSFVLEVAWIAAYGGGE